MIKYNNNTIYDWNFDTSNLIKVYRNNVIVFYKVSGESPTPEWKVCFAVVDDISQYQETEFDDVYDKATEKWYKLNNLNQYEEYGVYGSGKNITYYQGKLTIDDGYEYEWNGSSWVNLGEVTGSTASLPNVPFTVNYNAANYDASTKTFAKTNGQLADTDVTISGGTITAHDGYVTVASGSRGVISGYGTYFNRTSSTPNLTIISKQRTVAGSYCHMFANRSSSGNYNWMYRPYSNKLTLHGISEQGQLAVTTQPVIESVRIDSNRHVTYNNYTNSTSSTASNFNYGSTNGSVALFAGYTDHDGEWFVGDFYWIYMSQTTLTDAQVQEVINYNEGGGEQSEYPKYYSEKSDPLNNLTFNTLDEAQTYAYNNCVYDGMRATIDGYKYYFDSEDENGWVKILEYYNVEDVTPNQASGWTISGSSTYNPNSSYYDDFDIETTSNYATKIAKVTIYGYDHFTYYLRSYHGFSSSYSYVMATNVDEVSTPPSTMSYNSSSAITHTYTWNKSPKSSVNLSNYRRVTYNNLDKTVEHTFYVYFYGRSYGGNVGNATILIPKEQTNENWEQVTFSASSNVASSQKNLYIDGNNSTSGGTNIWSHRWIVGLPSGSHTSYTNYSSYEYCPNVTSSTFTSVAGEQRQVNFTYDGTTSKSLSFRLADGNGNVLTPSDTVYYTMRLYNSCNAQLNSSNLTFPRNQYVKVGGGFAFFNSSNRHYIYGYQAPELATRYNTDDYQDTFDIVYTKLNDEAVTITYTTYDPNDVETPAFNTDITYPYDGGTTSSTTLTSFDVPYTYPYEVSQESDKFSADSQTYTAGQASRTISFTLYPNNREFATLADLEAYGYAWEGMTAYIGSDKYVYQNGEWVYNPSRLPDGYTEVEYIENAAAATNVQSTSFLSIAFADSVTSDASAYTYTVVFEPTSLSNTYNCVLGNYYIRNQALGSNYKRVSVKFVSYEGDSVTNELAVGRKTEAKTYWNEGESYPKIEVKNITADTTTTTVFNRSISLRNDSNKIGLFNIYNFSDSGARTFVGKIYEAKVENRQGNLLAHGIPCVRTSDGKCGFYNLARDEFEYDASGLLTLTAGPEV